MIDWLIYGNVDTGNYVGDLSDNLVDESKVTLNAFISNTDGVIGSSTASDLTDYIDTDGSAFVISGIRTINILSSSARSICFYDSDKHFIGGVVYSPDVMSRPVIISDILENTKYVRFAFDKAFENGIMLSIGTTFKPYEPYGYDVPIKVNNTDTYHCYITDVLRKSDGENPVFDTMSSDGTIIRRVDTDGTPLEDPITETYTAPDITVNWGWNTIDVDTTVKPSSMTINYKDD